MEICGENRPHMAELELERYHKENKEKAINKFRSTKKMGSQGFQDQLSKEIEEYEYLEFALLE